MHAGDSVAAESLKYDEAKKTAEMTRIESNFAKLHRNDTDEELLQYVKASADKLGHIPRKGEIPGYVYIKSRFGPWPRVLEKAGLKQRVRREIDRKSYKTQVVNQHNSI
jgi:hypothetical protein